jgi:ERCC4-type nuclease
VVMSKIKILVDDREQHSNLLVILEQNCNVESHITRLKTGDYLVDDWLLIERKHICDLVESLVSGRLFSQASRLAKSGYKTAILIEGQAHQIASYKIHRHAILGALVTLTLVYGISILRSSTADESVSLMVFAANQHAKSFKEPLARYGRRPKSEKGKQLFILQGLPNVGPVLARRLLAHFGSVKNVLCADIEQLSAVKGMGDSKAKKIVSLIS